MTDAYAAYAYFNKIKDCTHVCCWAHARRIFYYAFKDYKDKLAKAFLDLIKCLYKIEVRAHNLPQDRRRDCQYKEKGSNSNPSYPQPEGHGTPLQIRRDLVC